MTQVSKCCILCSIFELIVKQPVFLGKTVYKVCYLRILGNSGMSHLEIFNDFFKPIIFRRWWCFLKRVENFEMFSILGVRWEFKNYQQTLVLICQMHLSHPDVNPSTSSSANFTKAELKCKWKENFSYLLAIYSEVFSISLIDNSKEYSIWFHNLSSRN